MRSEQAITECIETSGIIAGAAAGTCITRRKKAPYTSSPSCPTDATRCPRRAAAIMKLDAPPTYQQ